MVYVVVALPIMIGFCSLAVDFGYVQLAKFQLQQVADASAHDYMVLYNQYGSTSSAQSHISTTKNTVFTFGPAPNVSVNWGYWSPKTQTFSASSSTGAARAVQVTASCSSANSNPIPMLFASIIGQKNCSVSVTSVAATMGTSSAVSIDATQNLYFAGMPSTITNSWGDSGTANAAMEAASIPVVPGTFVTFTSFTGTTSVVPGTMPYAGPSGVSSGFGTATQHGVSWDGTGTPTTENGIANAIMPESSLVGLFLDNNRPDSTAAPTAVVDWTQAAQKNQNSFTSLATKTPFYIGDGKNGAVTQTFQVPPGATRMFVGIWDGVDYNNNDGTISGTITVQTSVLIVQ